MLNEHHLEELCLGWFQETGWQLAHGPATALARALPEHAITGTRPNIMFP